MTGFERLWWSALSVTAVLAVPTAAAADRVASRAPVAVDDPVVVDCNDNLNGTYGLVIDNDILAAQRARHH